jgi:SAM-dependent methyltransferase
VICAVCGGDKFSDSKILWPELISAWGLAPHEVKYIDRQQGTICTKCGSNLRSIALAHAIRCWLSPLSRGNFEPWDTLRTHLHGSGRDILEVNRAGSLTPHLALSKGHRLVEWPQIDMTNMVGIADHSFDLVVHSDTLEHVFDPVAGLAECRRVLRYGGACIYTVPIIIDRMTASRLGMPASYHGDPGLGGAEAEHRGLRVHTEFGADAWRWPIAAGFSAVEIVAFEWPAALALIARR